MGASSSRGQGERIAGLLGFEILTQPRAGVVPGVVGLPLGDAEGFGCLLHGQSREIAELDDFGREGIGRVEPVEGVVEGQQFVGVLARFDGEFIEWLPLSLAAPLERCFLASPFDENTAHGFGRSGQKMPVILPGGRRRLSDQPQIGFMHQGRRIQRLAGLFVRHFRRRQPPQFFIDLQQQILGRSNVSLFDLCQNAGHFRHAKQNTPPETNVPVRRAIRISTAANCCPMRGSMVTTMMPWKSLFRLGGLGRALSNRNYRLFFAGQGTSLIGTWMSRLATSWLVYRWSGDNAAWMLGVVSFMALAPIFVLSPIAGVFVDRWDRYRVLLVTQILSLLQSAALAVVAFTAQPEWGIWLVCGLSLLQGVINSFDMPARQSLLVALIARREDLPNAIALNSSLVNGSRLIGPMIAGFVIAVTSEAWCFVFDAISYIAVVIALLAMQVPSANRKPVAGSIGAHLVEGVRYAWGFPPIRALLLLLAVVSFSTMTQSVLMPVFAAELLKGGPGTLGLLSGASGLGALGGALYLASRSSVLGLGKVIIVSTTILGFALAGFAWSHSLWISAACLVAVGGGMMVEMAACNTLIQTMVDEDKRGRVMGFYSMAFQGTAPFGSLLTGLLSHWIGVREVVLGSAGIIVVAAITFATQLPRLRKSAQPVYERLGILPAAAQGINTATETVPGQQ